MEAGVAVTLSALFGGIIGSFLNVVAWRLPRPESLSRPGARCPGCQSPIRPYDNIPVLSWLLLPRPCPDCRIRIPWRSPAVEAGTAALCAIVALAEWGDGARLWLGLVLVLLLVPITLIDLEHRIIPNRIVLPGCAAAIALLGALDPGRLPEHVIAGVAAYVLLDVAAFLRPGAMGGGDVKLALMLGLFLGGAVVPALFVAFIAGSIIGVAIIARIGLEKGRKTGIPFGPYLALGGVVGIIAGNAIVDWYLRTFV